MNIRQWPNSLSHQRRLHQPAASDDDLCDFLVIGELKNDSQQLLVVGNDGQFYAYNLLTGEISHRIPDDSWAVDIAVPDSPRSHEASQKLQM